MTFRIATMAFAALLAACGSQGSSNEAQAQTASKPLEIAGISIGMSAKRVEALLKNEGWSLRPFRGFTWEQAVERVVARERGSITVGSDGIGGWNALKGDEEIVVSLHPTPDGGVVAEVLYMAPVAGRTPAEFKAELAKRFGSPTIAKAIYADSGVWCGAGDPKCVGGRVEARLPYLKAAYNENGQGRVKLQLAEGSEATRAWEDQRTAAVRAKMKGAKASF